LAWLKGAFITHIFMFVDSVTLTLSAGNGGNGAIAWRREKFIPKGGPTGGNGGRGGSIRLRTDPSVLSLEGFRNRRIMKAENGLAGGSNLKQGRNGRDLTLSIPPGTIVKDLATQEILLDCTDLNQEWLLCSGGKGGKGNDCFKSPTNQAPNICTPGIAGDVKEVELELKLIADVGLIGMPNAGKSTLLSKLTHTKVKIGAYPFTTLYPNLSYVQFDDYSRVLLADIPGIIENAHLDKGLGISFLKHIERTRVLIFMIDVSGEEGRDPLEDLLILQNELKAYRQDLMDKPFLVALNKVDLPDATVHLQRFRKEYPFDPTTLFPISAKEGVDLPPLLEKMRELAQAGGKHF
jgi:GTPase